MSTWLYLECLDHTPPLRAPDESGQYLYDLPRIRSEIATRNVLVRNWDAIVAQHGEHTAGEHYGYFPSHSIRFLREHPTCRLTIRDEYGVEHPTTDPKEADR